MVRICLQGAAQGVWKEITARAVAGREERWVWKAVSEVMSVIWDMVGGWGGGVGAFKPDGVERGSQITV